MTCKNNGEDILAITVHTVHSFVNMNDYNNSYFCVTLLQQFHETAENYSTKGKIVNMNSMVLTGIV